MQKEEEQINEKDPGTPQSPPPAYTELSVKKPTGPQNPPPPPPPPEEDEEEAITNSAPTRGSRRLERQECLDSGKTASYLFLTTKLTDYAPYHVHFQFANLTILVKTQLRLFEDCQKSQNLSRTGWARTPRKRRRYRRTSRLWPRGPPRVQRLLRRRCQLRRPRCLRRK